MSDVRITISLDDAFDCYEVSKRNVSEVPLYYYDYTQKEFAKIKSTLKNPGVVFINSYQLCLKLIDEYLIQPEMEKHKRAFSKSRDRRKNRIVGFLWYFEHIDGCYGFRAFEIAKLRKELIKWCNNNDLNYIEPQVYQINTDQ